MSILREGNVALSNLRAKGPHQGDEGHHVVDGGSSTRGQTGVYGCPVHSFSIE